MKRSTDKRKFERVPFRESVVVDLGDATTAGTAADLSLGGMFVGATEAMIPFGARVTVHVRVSGELLELPGVVRWNRSGGIGVQFGLLGARETHAITEAIARHSGKYERERSGEIVVVTDDDVELTG